MNKISMEKLLEAAYAALARRDMTAKELADKLKAACPGCPGESVAGVIEEMKENGGLDDARYARDFIERRAARRYGRRRIEYELLLKGVPRDIAAAALTEYYSEDRDIINDIEALIGRGTGAGAPNDPKEIRRLTDRLTRRGYEYEQIREALKNMTKTAKRQDNGNA